MPDALQSIFEPVLNILRKRHGSQTNPIVRQKVMHHHTFGTVHNCVKGCSNLFPVQTCQDFCGGIVILVCALAILLPDLWNHMIFEENSFNGREITTEYNTFIKLLRNPSSHALIWRTLMISWLVQKNIVEVGFGPILRFFPPPIIQSPPMVIQSKNYDVEFPQIGFAESVRSEGTIKHLS
jgi:hypothetical protein